MRNSMGARVRAPRVRAQINGCVIDTILHVDMIARGSCKSSRIELTVSTNRTTSDTSWLNHLGGKVTVKIFIGLLFTDVEAIMFEGLADNVALDPINGVARIQGRDYSSVLINSSYQDSYNNRTASEIATSIAARHGFNPNIAATTTMAGGYQGSDYNQLLLNAHSQITSEWDLLIYLARTERSGLFVDGTTLVFAPLTSLQKSYLTVGRGEAMAIKFFRSCPLSDKTRLVVKSWNSWLGQTFLHADNQSSDQIGPSIGDTVDHSDIEIAIVRPNLTPVGAEGLAQQYYDALAEQASCVEIVMPGDMSVAPNDVLEIETGETSFDGNYTVKSVRRHFSHTAGFIQYIRGFATVPNLGSSLGMLAS